MPKISKRNVFRAYFFLLFFLSIEHTCSMVDRMLGWLKRRSENSTVTYSRFGLPGDEVDERPAPTKCHVAHFDDDAPEYRAFFTHSTRAATISAGFGLSCSLFSFVMFLFEFRWDDHGRSFDVGTIGEEKRKNQNLELTRTFFQSPRWFSWSSDFWFTGRFWSAYERRIRFIWCQQSWHTHSWSLWSWLSTFWRREYRIYSKKLLKLTENLENIYKKSRKLIKKNNQISSIFSKFDQISWNLLTQWHQAKSERNESLIEKTRRNWLNKHHIV